MDKLDEHFMLPITGPRKSGKSYLNTLMLEKGMKDQFDHIIVMCPTIEFNDDYLWMIQENERLEEEWRSEHFNMHKYKPKYTMISNINDEIIETLYNTQAACMRKVKKRQRKGEEIYCPSTLLILDDCIDSGVVSFRGVVDKVAERGRHINLSCILCSQRVSAVSASIRRNSDYFIMFRPWNIAEMERFISEFVSKSVRKEVWKVVSDVFETPRNFILVDNLEEKLNKRLKYSDAHRFVERGDMSIVEVPTFENVDIIKMKSNLKRRNADDDNVVKKSKK